MSVPFSTTITALAPERDYQFSMSTSSVALVDSGSDAVNLPAFGDSGTFGRIAGPTVYEGDFALPCEESGNFREWVGTAGVDEILHSAGTLVVAFRMRSGWQAAGNCPIFGYGNTGGGVSYLCYLTPTGQVYVRAFNGGGVNEIGYVTAANTITDTDTDWHLLIVRQPDDGTGWDFYLDGSAVSTTKTLVGAATNDWWFSDISALASCRLSVAQFNNGGGNFSGDLSRIVITDTVATDQQIADLWANYLELSSTFGSKTIRRRGRRLFFDFSA